MEEHNFCLVYSYSRKQAIEDEVLIDITRQAKAAGFKLNTAISHHLYHQYIVPPEELETQGQSIQGRLNDLFVMLHLAIGKNRDSDRVCFDVLFLIQPGKTEKVTIVAIVGPGDSMEPVLTICLPEDV